MLEELRALEEDVLEGDVTVSHAFALQVNQDIEELLDDHARQRFIKGADVTQSAQ